MTRVLLLLLMMMVINLNASAQTDFDKSIDKENNAVVYKGQFTFEDLGREATFDWLERGTKSYKPDSVTVDFLKRHLHNYNLVILLGTWCDDSQALVPRLYKTLQASGFPMNQYSMYGVDRAKEAKYVEHKLYRLERVPTIIVYKNHLEIGRIVEVAEKTVEKDLAKIIEADLEQE